MIEIGQRFKAWKESGSNLSFKEWKKQNGLTESNENKTPTPENKTLSNTKPKKKYYAKGKEMHLYLDGRILDRLRNEKIGTKINEILRAYFDIPATKYDYDALVQYPEMLENLEKERLEKIKEKTDKIKGGAKDEE